MKEKLKAGIVIAIIFCVGAILSGCGTAQQGNSSSSGNASTSQASVEMDVVSFLEQYGDDWTDSEIWSFNADYAAVENTVSVEQFKMAYSGTELVEGKTDEDIQKYLDEKWQTGFDACVLMLQGAASTHHIVLTDIDEIQLSAAKQILEKVRENRKKSAPDEEQDAQEPSQQTTQDTTENASDMPSESSYDFETEDGINEYYDALNGYYEAMRVANLISEDEYDKYIEFNESLRQLSLSTLKL
jgi:hypothetical protein